MRYCVLLGTDEEKVTYNFDSACKMHNRNFDKVEKYMLDRFGFDIFKEVSEEYSEANKAGGNGKCFSIDGKNKISIETV
jgi:hypothetical protein